MSWPVACFCSVIAVCVTVIFGVHVTERWPWSR